MALDLNVFDRVGAEAVISALTGGDFPGDKDILAYKQDVGWRVEQPGIPGAHTHVQSEITDWPLTTARGGSGIASPTADRLMLTAGASPFTLLAAGGAGQVVRSTGSAWASAALISADLPSHTHNASEIGAGTFGAGNFVFPGNLTMSSATAVIDFTGAAGKILFKDNEAAPLQIGEGFELYMGFVSTNGAEKVEFAKPVTMTGTLSVSGVSTFGTYTGQSSIVTLGTIATGVWSGTTILTAKTVAKVISVTAGAGMTGGGGETPTLNVIGTASRISVSANAINIDTGYVGQATITTLGTIGTGTWNATTIGVAKGGTGLTSPAANQVMLTNDANNFSLVDHGNTGNVLLSSSNDWISAVLGIGQTSGNLPASRVAAGVLAGAFSFSSALQLVVGSAAAPSLRGPTAADRGIYFPSSTSIGFTIAGVERLFMQSIDADEAWIEIRNAQIGNTIEAVGTGSTIDFDKSNMFSITNDGSKTVVFNAERAGFTYIILIDPSGSPATGWTWPVNEILWVAGAPPTLSTNTNQWDVVHLICFAPNSFLGSHTLAHAA